MADNNETATEGKAKETRKEGISIRVISAITIIVGLALALFAFSMAGHISELRDAAEADETRYVACEEATNDLQDASDFMSTEARVFVSTGRVDCLESYVEELTINNRRGKAVDVLRTTLAGEHGATSELIQALVESNQLALRELAAMKLAAEYYQIENLPPRIANAQVDSDTSSMNAEQKLERAKQLVLTTDYDDAKQAVTERVEASSAALLDMLNAQAAEKISLLQDLMFQLRLAIALLLCTVMVLVLVLLMYVLKPLDRYIKRIEKKEPLEEDGSYELRYLANAYNVMYEDNNKRIEQLRQFAERDALTGISNRNGYDSFLATHTRDIALLLIDIDNFKDFNQVYGHDTGDAVLVKLGKALSSAFRSTDFPCRIESDKFAVIMTNMNTNLRDAVSQKIELVNSMLADDSDDLPLVTLSVGAAFSTDGMTDKDIYRAASAALKHVQENGMNGLAFYGEEHSME